MIMDRFDGDSAFSFDEAFADIISWLDNDELGSQLHFFFIRLWLPYEVMKWLSIRVYQN